MSRPSAINSTAHMDMDSFTVGVVEQRLHRKRWCAYHGTFHDLESFSDAQKMAPFANRYCLQFSNHTVRAAAHVRPPTISVVDMRALSSKLKITIDNLPAIAEPDGRASARKRNTEASDDDDEIPDDTPEPLGKRVKATAASSAGGSKAAQPKRKSSTSPAKAKTSKAAAPKDRPLLSVEELESWIATSLSSTERYDIHDNSRRDNYLGTIESYNESDLTDIDWQTALGEVEADDGRKAAAQEDLRFLEENTLPEIAVITDKGVRKQKQKYVRKIQGRLFAIVKGKVGFADLSRKFFREQGGGDFIVDGTRKTCMQDTVAVVARWMDVNVSNAQVMVDLSAPDGEELEIYKAINYMREKLHLSVQCLTIGPNSLSRQSGGAAAALLRSDIDTAIVTLIVELTDGNEERHTVALLNGLQLPTHPEYRGAIVDNDSRVGVRLLDENDRTTEGARKIFDNLFWTAKSVRITSVWEVKAPLNHTAA